MSNPWPPRPTKLTSLAEYPYVVLRLRCHVCERWRDCRVAILAWEFRPETPVGEMLHLFMRRCPWDPHNPARKPQKYGMRCGAYLPDLNSGRPPDLPPSMACLTVIEGGRDEMLPAEAVPLERRRRVGGEDE
jgi:hypothetical protein